MSSTANGGPQPNGKSQTARDDDLVIYTFCFFVLLGATSRSGEFGRYFLYALPLLAFSLGLFKHGRLAPPSRGPEIWIAFAIILYSLATSAILQVFDSYTWRETLLISLPYFIAAYTSKTTSKHLIVMGCSFCVAVIVAAISGHAKEAGLSWSESSSLAETAYAFPLALILLALFMSGRGRLFQAGFAVFSIVSLKRIAVVGFALSVIVFLVHRYLIKFRGIRALRLVQGEAIVVFILLAAVGLNLPAIVLTANHYIRLYYLSPEELLQGRYFLQTYIANYALLHSTSLTPLFGHGIGRVPYALSQVQGREPLEVLVHDDYLKMYFEGGYLFLAGYCGALIYFYSRSGPQLAILIYQFSLFVTDNTLVYVFHISVLLFCLRYFDESVVHKRRKEALAKTVALKTRQSSTGKRAVTAVPPFRFFRTIE